MKTEFDFYFFHQGPHATLQMLLNGEMYHRHALNSPAQALGSTLAMFLPANGSQLCPPEGLRGPREALSRKQQERFLRWGGGP